MGCRCEPRKGVRFIRLLGWLVPRLACTARVMVRSARTEQASLLLHDNRLILNQTFDLGSVDAATVINFCHLCLMGAKEAIGLSVQCFNGFLHFLI
jgi:hypothetical protein